MVGRFKGLSQAGSSGAPERRSQDALVIEPISVVLNFFRVLVCLGNKVEGNTALTPCLQEYSPTKACTPITTGNFVTLMIFKWLVTLISILTY